MSEKTLIINSDLCDARTMKEEDYAQYERIILNCDVLIVNEQSKSILARLPVTMNQDETIEADGPVHLKTVNGSCKLGASSETVPNTILVVNGSLKIQPDAAPALKNYVRISVNGSVQYPEQLDAVLPPMSVNGSIHTYPGDYIQLDRIFTLDRYFPLRAKEGGKYYADRRITVKDPDLDLKRLLEKGVHFRTPTLLTLAEKAEDCAALFEEETKFIIVPTGMRIVEDDCVVDHSLIRRNGTRIFVYGDAKLGDGCEKLEQLIVKGTLTLTHEQVGLLDGIDVEYEELKIYRKGRRIEGRVHARIDKALLSRSPDGISVDGVASVKLDSALTPDDILEHLSFENCARIICTEEQISAVHAVAENVASIGAEENEEDDPFSALKFLVKHADAKIIHADSYLL